MRATHNIKIIPIRRDILASDEVREVTDLAYDLWLAESFRGCSPEEALFAAVRQLGKKTASPFLVPKRNSTERHPYPLSRIGLN
jgi:hypothetical protein